MPKIIKPKIIDPRPYRSLDFNDERKWKSNHFLDDVLQVGTHKAIGYVVDNESYQHKEFDLQTLAEQMRLANKLVSVVKEDNLIFLWVGESQMMVPILDRHKDLILANGWPTIPEEFFDRISKEDIHHRDNSSMYHVVCELFNSWCLWCEKPIQKKFVDGSTRFISRQPYDPK